MLGNVIADEIAGLGESGTTNALHLRWDNNESHELKLLQEDDSVQLPGWEPNVPRLKSMLMKLKKGKAAPDGVTSEVLHNLPAEPSGQAR